MFTNLDDFYWDICAAVLQNAVQTIGPKQIIDFSMWPGVFLLDPTVVDGQEGGEDGSVSKG